MRIRLAALFVLALVATGGVPLAGAATGPEPPPPTPVPPFGSPSPFPTALDTPAPSAAPPEVSAPSATLFDLETGQVLVRYRPRAQRPIASTTKIMTALLLLERTTPEELVTASRTAASQSGAVVGLDEGERARVEDLLFALMLQSANDAAVALAEHVGGTVDAFVARMNRRAARLGLDDTSFASPNGLDDSGYSSAADLATLTVAAYRMRGFAEIVATKFHTVPAPSGPDRRIQNRNALLWLYRGAIGVKTGYTFAARYCLVASAEREGMRLGAVVLGAPFDAFSDAARLLNYGFDRFEQETVVDRGEDLGPVAVDGLDVPVEAARDLELLVEEGADVRVAVRPLDGLELPLEERAKVGIALVRVDDELVGRLPVVAAEAVGTTEPPDDGSWWDGAAETVGDVVLTVLRALFG